MPSGTSCITNRIAMKQIEFPMSALEIMQACLAHYDKNSKDPEASEKAGFYLGKIENVISDGTVTLSSLDFLEIHRFVISIYSSIIDNGKVSSSRWTDKQWVNVLKYIEDYYSNNDTYEVKKKA